MKMFLITYHAKPIIKTTEFAGAYINCWIEEKTFENADSIAKKEIEDANWKVKTLEEVIQVTKGSYSEKDPKREYYEQALIDKSVYVFNTYPKRKLKK